MKRFYSFPATAGILAAMAAYLVRGKYYGGSLDPRVMLAFACLLAIQGGGAMTARIRLLVKGRPAAPPAGLDGCGVRFRGQAADATRLLAGCGLLPQEARAWEGVACYGRRVRLAVVVELVAYGGLLFALVCGAVNYGLGLRGYAMVSPSTAWVELESNAQMVQEGFMADRSALAYRMKVSDLRHGGAGKKARVSFEIAGRDGARARAYDLTGGEAVDIGKIRLRFMDDTYMVFSYATKGTLDYQAEPIYLHRREKSGDGLYRGTLRLNQPGGSGEVTYDPETGSFRIVLRDQGRIGLDRTVPQGEVARQGEYAAQVTGLGHFARIDVWRHSYRNEIFAGLIIMAGAFGVRLFCRPLTAWLWTRDGTTFFHTRHRRLRRLLASAPIGS